MEWKRNGKHEASNLLVFVCIVVAAGCAFSAPGKGSPAAPPRDEETVDRVLGLFIGELRDAIDARHLPVVTQFDDSPTERAQYLECFADGYRSAVVGILRSMCERPESRCRSTGWSDGQSAGFDVFMDIRGRIVTMMPSGAAAPAPQAK